MYICVCKGITCSHIRDAASKGVCRLRDLSQKTGVATQCGKCARCAKDVLKQAVVTAPA